MDIVVAICSAVIAGIMQATVGFGFAVVFTPLMSFAVGARAAVATSMLMSVVLAAANYYVDRPRASLRSIALMVAAATCAIPLGVWVLANADERLLNGVIGVAVLVSVVVSVFTPHRHEERPERWPTVVGVGVLSGILRGATSMGGPPVVLYEHSRGIPPSLIRSRLLGFFALTGATSIPIAAAGGIFTADTGLYAVAALPAAFGALVLGRWLRKWVSDIWFRYLSMGLLAVMGLLSLGNAVW
ncbi:MAG: sulfite exporter TauE/SafE family protein [Dehalococcoidia bacterium]